MRMMSYFIAGCVDEVNSLYTEIPEGNFSVVWEVIRDGGVTNGSDSFSISFGDSLTYLLEY